MASFMWLVFILQSTTSMDLSKDESERRGIDCQTTSVTDQPMAGKDLKPKVGGSLKF